MDIQKPKVQSDSGSREVPIKSGAVRPMGVNRPVRSVAPMPSPSTPPNQPETGHVMKPIKPKRPWKIWVLVTVVMLLVGGGAFAWQQYYLGGQIDQLKEDNGYLKQGKDQAQKEADDAKKAADAATAAAGKAASASTAAVDFFEVKELGFKFKPGADLKDLVYILDGETARFSTRSLMAAAFKEHRADGKEELWCTPGFSPLGAVKKPTADVIAKKTVTTEGPQATCSDVKAVNDLATSQKTKLVEALKTAEEIK